MSTLEFIVKTGNLEDTNLEEISSEGDRIQWGEGLNENNRTGGENIVRYEKAGSRKKYVRDN